MTEERMSMAESAAGSNAMYLAEHIGRYAVLQPLVRGLRVLDIACGEGYGSWLLKEWGAASVVGVDISAKAIDAAQRQFGRDGVRYLAGDACAVTEQLEPGSFDLIVSFETVEHVSDPARFLRGLKTLAAPKARIFISCPNDHVAMPPEQSNPYHLRKYTLEEFRADAEMVLGPASTWLLGANVQGYGLISAFATEDHAENIADLIKEIRPYHAYLLPSQRNIQPNPSNVLYYIGVWGEMPSVLPVAVAAQSYKAFVEPWQALDWFKAESVRMEGERNELQMELDCVKGQLAAPNPLADELGRVKRENTALNGMLVRLGSDLRGKAHDRAEERLADAQRQIVALNAIIARLGSQARNSVEPTPDSMRVRDAEEKLNAILQTRSWRYTRVLRVLARLARGEFNSVRESFRTSRQRL